MRVAGDTSGPRPPFSALDASAESQPGDLVDLLEVEELLIKRELWQAQRPQGRPSRPQVGTPSTSSGPEGDTSVLQGTSYRARRYPDLLRHPVCGLTPGVELGGPVQVVVAEYPAIPLRDAMSTDVVEDGRPIHPERRRQLLYWDTPTVSGHQVGYLAWRKAPLNRERGDQGVGRVNRRLAGALP